MQLTAGTQIRIGLFLLVVCLLLWLLSPMLMPFAVSAGLAYLCSPIVDALERLRLPRTVATLITFLFLLLLIVLFILVITPVLQKQITILMASLPSYIQWANQHLKPLVQDIFGLSFDFNGDSFKQLLGDHWKSAGVFAKLTLEHVTSSGTALIGFVINLFLIPVILFYLMRDWHRLIGWFNQQLPRRHESAISQVAREIDHVLGQFMRGQLAVMLVLGIVYACGLWLMGLKLAFVIGIVAGLVSFVPYLGVITGLALSSIAVMVQTGEFTGLIWVGVIFAIGQILETMILQPLLIGDAIGMHPVWVIFVVLAGGYLFGFIGVLLALPVGAAAAVLVRRGAQHWRNSRLYLDDPGAQ